MTKPPAPQRETQEAPSRSAASPTGNPGMIHRCRASAAIHGTHAFMPPRRREPEAAAGAEL
jgi:hypothetical protein